MDSNLPIIEITEQNKTEVWPLLQKSVGDCTYMAIDSEMSGLGDRKKLFLKEIDTRYNYMVELASNYATLSVGICCYQQTSNADISGKEQYKVQTFNILVQNTQPFTVEASSLKFLLRHGFDLNRQALLGLPYTPGNDAKGEKPNKNEVSMRGLFSMMVAARKAIVFHNGLVDLIFLYHHFYAHLPSNIEMFAADLHDMFPEGIFDTKYFSEYHYRCKATYLQYLYVKELKDSGKVEVSFDPVSSELKGVKFFPYQQNEPTAAERAMKVCSPYSYHGWCENGSSCPESHNMVQIIGFLKIAHCKSKSGSRSHMTGTLDVIRSHHQQRKNSTSDGRRESSKDRIPKSGDLLVDKTITTIDLTSSDTNKIEKKDNNNVHAKSESPSKIIDLTSDMPLENEDKSLIEVSSSPKQSDVNSSSNQSDKNNEKNKENNSWAGHSSGFDAFMTGYIFASIVQKLRGESEEEGLADHINKVYMMAKNSPFLVRQSSFAKLSKNHSAKIKLIRDE